MLKSSAERVVVVSIIITTVFGAVEVSAAFLFGTMAFLAAGVDALFDTLTSIGVFAGLRVSRRPADRGHPYGHRQAETLVSVLLAVALVFASVRIALLSLDQIYLRTPVEAAPELFLLAALALLVLGALARYKINTGKRTKSSSLVADGYHTLSDSVSAAAVFVGLVLIQMGHAWADPVIAIGISILILHWGLRVGYDAINVLMGASPGARVMDDIKRICRDVPGVKGCHKCRARRVGSRIFADIHILVDPKLSVEESHEVATQIERRLKARVVNLTSVVVHIEPTRRRQIGEKR